MRKLPLPVHRPIVALVSIAAVVLLVHAPTGAADAFRRGDVNGDGVIDVSDGTRLLLSLFGRAGVSSCADAEDADDSGVLDLADAAFTFAFLFTGGAAPPAPGFIECGEDPTADALGCEAYLPCSLSESRDVGPEGGRLEYSSGVVLDIPPGAVTADTTITLGELPEGVGEVFRANPINGLTLLGGFSAEPDGLVFEVPITASLPIEALPPGSLPVAMGADLEAGISWLEETDITYFPEQSRMEVAVFHFSNRYYGSIDGFTIVTEVSDIPADDKCREDGIRVTSKFADFESVARTSTASEACAAVSDNVEVQFLGCDGATERVVASSIQGNCDIKVDILGTRTGIIDVELPPSECRLDLDARVTIRSRLDAAQELGVELAVFWSSNNEDVATVDPITGLMTVHSPGMAEITAATADPRFRDVANVIVAELKLEPELEMVVGDEFELTVNCPQLRWESTAPDVASFRSGTDVLVGHTRGRTTVRVFAGNDPQPFASANVTVFSNVRGTWTIDETLTITDVEEGATGTCTATGAICVDQDGSKVDGVFETTVKCTINYEDGPESFEYDDDGKVEGRLTLDGFSYDTISGEVGSDYSEVCTHQGSLGDDIPQTLTSDVHCTEEFRGEVITLSEGEGTGTKRSDGIECQ